ncbi:hypothetical protein ACFVH6_15665 [Spirillospora sp. NPDC127200]
MSGTPLSPGVKRLVDRFPPALLVLGLVLLIPQILFGIGVAWPDGPEEEPDESEVRPKGPFKMTIVVTGDRRTAEVTYRLPDGTSHSGEDTALPVRKTFTASGGDTVSVSVSNQWRNGPGKVTCTVLVGDKIVQQATDFGDNASAVCPGVGVDAETIPGATVPTQGNGLLPGETRLARTVPVKRYKGKGSPLAGRVSDSDPRLSYMSLGGEWSRSRQVDPQMSGHSRKQRFDSEAKWEAVLASGLVNGDLVAANTGKNRLRALAGAVQDYRQTLNFDETARGRDVASQPIRVSGRKGWVVVREIRFAKKGVRARMDLSAVAIVDTGRPRPSYVWIDIPETHKRLWPDVNTVLDSLRVG